MTTTKHEVPEELLTGLLANYKKPEDLIGENAPSPNPPPPSGLGGEGLLRAEIQR
ncbi:MAG: hypothetical protein JSR65_00795 [Proteobacteria bacterium]|nr:hypothetical protein [Pseudomonadota bacterium]